MKKNLFTEAFRGCWNCLKRVVYLSVFTTTTICTSSFAQIQLVKDLNTTAHNAFGEFGETKEVNGITYVAANQGLWKTNGTQAGSVLLKQFISISSFVVFRNQLFFVAETSVHGAELWKSDGTASGTVLVKDIEPGKGGSSPVSLVVANNYLFMIANTTAYGKEVWRSNGSTGGTFILRDIIRGKLTSNPSSLVAYKNRLFFAASDGLAGQELWTSDGSTTGTKLFADIRVGKPGSGPGDLTVSGAFLFFQALDDSHGRELWRTDGTMAGTLLVRDIRPGTANSTPRKLIDVSGTLYFAAKEGPETVEFWRSDGTPGGTNRAFVFEGETAFGIWTPLRDVASANGKLYFLRANGLYEYDGTGEHPHFIMDLGDFYELTGAIYAFDDVLYMTEEFYSYDDETSSVTNIYKYQNGVITSIQSFTGTFQPNLSKTSLGLLFNGPTNNGKFMLWKSNGTYGGSSPFFDVTDFNLGSNPSLLTQLSGNVLFVASDNSGRSKLFKMDGTTTDVELISDVQPQTMRLSGSRVYFDHQGDLWRTNGTSAGTALVRHMHSSSLENFTDVNGTLFFTVTREGNTRELWKSTGSYASTVKVKDIYGYGWDNPSNLLNLNGTLFFLADHPTYGRSVWKSDGTEAGTIVVRASNPAYSFDRPTNLVATQSHVFFLAHNNTTGIELYRTDGTPSGTVRVKDLRPDDFTPEGGASEDITSVWAGKNKIYFLGTTADNVNSLWVSDGTGGGTIPLTPISSWYISYLKELNGVLHFVESTEDSRLELYSTDGTAEGTAHITTIERPDVYSSVVMDNVLYFGTRGYGNQSDLWRTDGTACGTFMVPSDLRYGISLPQQLLVNKDRRLVFTAYNSSFGNELFKLEKSHAPKSPCGSPTVATGDVLAELTPGVTDKDITSYPNPFIVSFTLRVDAAEDNSYSASIVNVNGVQMSSLRDLRTNENYEVGNELRAGMYLVKINMGTRTEVRCMIKMP